MHIHHPSLSLNGKRRGKVKFRNAEEARKARELESSWKELQKKWGTDAEEKKRKHAMSSAPLNYKLTVPAGRATNRHIPSLNSGDAVAAVAAPPKVYTGTEMIGIGQLHKSNAIPIFKKSDAEDLAKMRR